MAEKNQMAEVPRRKFREIRAQYDADSITVYQAYNAEIASAAVAAQRLSASASFKTTRMTWIKPSWCWMMYRSGYAGKDANQARVLALRMTHAFFADLLRHATLAHVSHGRGATTVVQWDPERGPRLGRHDDCRSIQIGIPSVLVKQWIDHGIVGIEDVTHMAHAMKTKLDEDPEVTTVEQLVALGLMPLERVYEVDPDIAEALEMG